MGQSVNHRILIVDSENIVGKMLAFIFEQMRSDSTQIALSRDEGWASIRAKPPDAVFVYLWADGVNASEFCQRLKSELEPKIPVIVWGMLEPKEVYHELRQAGATGYLHLPCGPEGILAARDAALSGEVYFP